MQEDTGRREARAEQTRARIREAARDLFMSQGYDETSMQDILDRSGVSKGGLYHHFPSKESILQDLVGAQEDRVANALQAWACKDLTTREKVTGWLRQVSASPDMTSLVSSRWAEKAPFALLSTLRSTMGRLSDQLASMLETGRRNGEFKCPDPAHTAQVLLILLDIWLDPLISGADSAEQAARMDWIMRFLDACQAPVIDPILVDEARARLKVEGTQP